MLNSLRHEMNDREFVVAVQRVVAHFGWRQVITPTGMLEQWSAFVDECERGYTFSMFEYANDRAIRDLLERVMFYPSVWKCSQMEMLRKDVNALDARFRACCRGDVLFAGSHLWWWCASVPALAEGDFAEDLAFAALIAVSP
jgi:hypothetical protein